MWITTKLSQEYNISLLVITSHSRPSHKTSQFLLSDEGLTKHNSPVGSWRQKQSTEALELDLWVWFYKQDAYSWEHQLTVIPWSRCQIELDLVRDVPKSSLKTLICAYLPLSSEMETGNPSTCRCFGFPSTLSQRQKYPKGVFWLLCDFNSLNKVLLCVEGNEAFELCWNKDQGTVSM